METPKQFRSEQQQFYLPFSIGLPITVCIASIMGLTFAAIFSHNNIKASFFVNDFIPAPGIITASKLKYKTSKNFGYYSPDITYKYFVEGKWLWSNKVAFKGTCGTKECANILLRKYPVGKKVIVLHSATDPALVALEPDEKLKFFDNFTGSTSILVLAFIISSGYLCYRRIKRSAA